MQTWDYLKRVDESETGSKERKIDYPFFKYHLIFSLFLFSELGPCIFWTNFYFVEYQCSFYSMQGCNNEKYIQNSWTKVYSFILWLENRILRNIFSRQNWCKSIFFCFNWKMSSKVILHSLTFKHIKVFFVSCFI